MSRKARKTKFKLNREAFIISNKCFILNMESKFSKKFKQWYIKGNRIVPYRIYDYIFKYHKSNKG